MDYFIYQSTENDCGFTCLKMLLADLNKDKKYLYLRKPKKSDCYTFYDIIELAKANNVVLKAYSYEQNDFKFPKTPFLALINEKHLVFVKNITKRHVFVFDPDKGKIKYKKDEFLKMFSFKTLEIYEHIQTNCHDSIKNRILPIRFKITKIALTLLPFISIIVGLFFVKSDSFVFIPIIFLTLFALFELVEKWYIFKEINFFDYLYIDKYFSKQNKFEDYQNYLSFKQKYFEFDNSFIASSVMSVVIIVIAIVNDPFYCFPILIILLVLIGKKALFAKKDNSIKEKICLEENNFKKIPNYLNAESVGNAMESANNFAFRKAAFKVFMTFVIIILSFLLMIYTKNISVNYILFNFGIFYLLIEHFEILLSASDKRSEFDKEKVKFLYKCY